MNFIGSWLAAMVMISGYNSWLMAIIHGLMMVNGLVMVNGYLMVNGSGLM